MIIGINGKIGSGKDTVGSIIQYLTLPIEHGQYIGFETYDNATLERNSSFKIKKFAGKLKTIASLLTGVPVEKFEDQEFKQKHMGLQWKMTYREFLQKLGTDALRDGLHTDVWVNALFADYKEVWKDPDPIPHNDYTITWRENYTEDSTLIHYGEGSEAEVFDYEIVSPNWIITDMRFPNEMEAVVERKGITIRVVRSFNHKMGSKETGTLDLTPLHPSETALDDAKFDYEIINDGTMEDLVEKVKEILIKEEII